jgi:FecR-like protein
MHLKSQQKGHNLMANPEIRSTAMARLCAILVSALLALCAGNALAQAAYVHELTGTVTATVAAGSAPRALKAGDILASGTTVSTGDKSTAVIKFEDGQVMALAEKTSFRIVDYRYNKQNVGQSSAVFSLLQGGLRFISGVIGSTNRNNFRMTAGTATIGIRGTDGVVNFDSVAQAVFVAVLVGAINMNTPQGEQTVGVGNFSSHVAGQNPTAPQPTSQATAAVQQVFDGLAVRNVPINTPVVVQTSALAAAAVANALQLAAQAAANPGDAALQAAAQEALKLAQASVETALQAAQQAYDQAVKEGGAQPPAPPAQLLPGQPPADSTTGTSTSGTPAGGSGSGGGGTSCGVSCN